MKLLKSRRDGAEGVREGRRAIAEEFDRRRALDEERVHRAERPRPTSEEAELAAKAQIAARTAAQQERNVAIQAVRDLISEAQRVRGEIEITRDAAIETGNLEIAIDQEAKALGVSELIATINAQATRRFGGQWR